MALKRSEKAVVGIVVGFVAVFGAVAYLTEGAFVSGAVKFMGSLEGKDANASRNAAINCQDKRNMRLPYCEERRARTEADWKGIVRYGGGQSNAFKLD